VNSAPLLDPRAARSRDALLAALWTSFQEGRTAPTITDIVKVAGVSRPTFYQHFADVPDLIRAAALERLRELFAHAPQLSDELTGTRFMHARLASLLGELQHDRAVYLPVLHGPAAVPVFADIVRYLADAFVGESPIRTALRAGVDEPEARARAAFLAAGVTRRVHTGRAGDPTGDNELEPTVRRLTANIIDASGAGAGTPDLV
jgi:AcrR family transcriptional regulator